MIMIIPGELIALLTFPGVVVHEIAHRFFCDIYNIKVYGVGYFNIGNTQAGHVLHEPIHETKGCAQLLVSIAPLLVNTFLGAIITFPHAAANYFPNYVAIDNSWMQVIWNINAWVGYSILFHAIPSNHDMTNATTKGSKSPFLLGFLRTVITVIAYICNAKYIGGLIKVLFVIMVSRVLPKLYYSLVL